MTWYEVNEIYRFVVNIEIRCRRNEFICPHWNTRPLSPFSIEWTMPHSSTHLLTMAPYSMSALSSSTSAATTMIAETPRSDKLLIVTNTEHDDYHPHPAIRTRPTPIRECGNDNVSFLKSRQHRIVERPAWRRIDSYEWRVSECECVGVVAFFVTRSSFTCLLSECCTAASNLIFEFGAVPPESVCTF